MQEKFCLNLAQGMRGDAAYAAAGYKPNRHNAASLRTKEPIIARVLELQGQKVNRVVLSKTYVVDALLENAEKALGRKPVKISRRAKNKDGEYVDEVAEVFVYEGQVANQAIRMAGLELGMFTERRDVKITNEYAHLTDEQLAQKLVEVGQLMLSGPVIEHGEDES